MKYFKIDVTLKELKEKESILRGKWEEEKSIKEEINRKKEEIEKTIGKTSSNFCFSYSCRT